MTVETLSKTGPIELLWRFCCSSDEIAEGKLDSWLFDLKYRKNAYFDRSLASNIHIPLASIQYSWQYTVSNVSMSLIIINPFPVNYSVRKWIRTIEAPQSHFSQYSQRVGTVDPTVTYLGLPNNQAGQFPLPVFDKLSTVKLSTVLPQSFTLSSWISLTKGMSSWFFCYKRTNHPSIGSVLCVHCQLAKG